MRRIVHYYPAAMGNSGVSFALWSWARAQAAAGFEVCVMHAPSECAGASVPFVSKQCYPGLTTLAVPHRGRHRLTLRPTSIERYLGRNDLLVLHEGWTTNNLVASAAARRAHIPYTVMPHGVYEPAWTKYLKPPRWLRTRLERHVLEGAAAVHLFFESEIASIQNLAPGARFMVLPTGYDVPEETWRGGGNYLAWIGRLDPIHKGLDLLIGAIAHLPSSERPLLRIRGYDYKGGAAALQQLISDRQMTNWVSVEPPVAGPEKLQFMQRADGYVHPSRWECHSIALLENLALGVPCLVSDTIHIAPTLERSRAALLSRPCEYGLASALPLLRHAPRGLAERGRHLVGTAFNWKQLMPQFRSSIELLGLP
jgi:glycosyltransferase involved in cell wall biosynthesis